ncbi:MAG TPA: enterochelin esterase, partial [Candidatus Limnocylindria bacterium]|nr:enterochelin esterase [Candidatus Limnocylindria bacterium]
MQSRTHRWAGTLHTHEIDSQALTGNPLGDPHLRPIYVYTPPAAGADPERRFPTLYLIQGLTGMVEAWRNTKPFQPNVPELIDALFADPATPPAI